MENIIIIGLYFAINTIIILGLSFNVIRLRVANKVSLGDGGNENLLRAIRAQGNATEYIPMAMIGLLVLNFLGAPIWAIHISGALITLGRISHCYGLINFKGVSIFRFFGQVATFTSLIWAAIFCLYSAF